VSLGLAFVPQAALPVPQVGQAPSPGRLPADNEMRLPVFGTVLQGISVVGSIVGTRVDLAEVFQLHAQGRTHVTYERRTLEQVNECFDDVLAGRTPARLVFGF
jgi:propanol-preferring alcohol dehydrogenase